jgi:peroxiredoxin Q/BCP
VIGEKVKNGVTVLGVIRSSFLVGVDGRVERVYRDVSPDGHVAQLRADLGL